ncbi:MAG TPA: SDR family oxidoreductase [Xanthobacteraceae bacterium]|nr:SDR family oxidoreductase [Xanthobacteraceae bacterium]
MENLRNRVVVVTGASAGVGRAIALRFATEGAQVGLIARDAEALDVVRAEVEKRGGKGFVAAADVSDAQAVFTAAEAIERHFGPIDIWVNDAMVTVFSPVWDMTPEEFRRVTEVTYLGCVHGTMAALRSMRPRNQGTIIQIGSALAYRGIPLQSAYCGAKHAIRGFTDSLRCELIHTGKAINLTVMELPAVNTPQFDWARTHMPRKPRPVPPVVEPEVIANAVIQAAHAPRREYWIGWSTLKVIIGNMLLPSYLDRYLAKAAFDAQETQAAVSPKRKDNLMEPVHDLHRTRGRFGKEAGSTALVAIGPEARIAPVVAGALAFLALGLVARRITSGGRVAKRHLPPYREEK